MIVHLLTHNGNALKLDIPYHCSEILFSEYIDFKAAVQELYADTDVEEDPLAEDANELLLISKCVLSVVKVIEGDISNLEFGVNEDIEELFNEDFTLTFGDSVNLVKLYVHLTTLIEGYKPLQVQNTFQLKVKDEYFFICPTASERILGLTKPYTVGEVIEVQEFNRKFGKQIEKGDLEGNLAFSLGLHELAVILRKHNERLPVNKKDRASFIKKRVNLFKTLPMTTVIDVRYFFLSILKRFGRTQLTNYSLKAKREYLLAQQQNKKPNEKPMPNGNMNWTEHLILSDGKFITP